MQEHSNDFINTKLVDQYVDALGGPGMLQTLDVFRGVAGSYLAALVDAVQAKDEQAFRAQAHKVKGASRSIGLAVLGDDMEHLEKGVWQWQEALDVVRAWQKKLPSQVSAVESYIRKKATV